jgi:hypothetical protein
MSMHPYRAGLNPAPTFSSRFVIPESAEGGYPWFDRLTTLSEVEGESRLKK